ncbi:thioesterase [Leptospira ognonensis]|uniref:Thioesterase n=1 Tax=Leptospira ognonensis TaxID=2484945 RepID=A0A4R9JWT4_9LEPT|nr:thioesterase family protein [Leptospira ognonensis]TGL56504.1 thioesterase [Leptospira ognonensis]
MTTAFIVHKKVRFQHCDPGGIVFTPQYFNLFVEVVEDWFDISLNYSFAKMVVTSQFGIPAMRIEARFHNPSYLEDNLEMKLVVKRLTESTALVEIVSSCAGEKRCSMELLYGYASLAEKRLTHWPTDVYERMQGYLSVS